MKSLKTKIEGLDVEIIKFNPLKGGTILGTTLKMFAPSIKEITKAAGDGLSDEAQIEVLVSAVEELFTRQTPKEVMEYVGEIITTGHVIVSGKKIVDIDDLESLSGDEGDALYLMSMITAESIKYNFSKFLGKLMPSQASSSALAKA